MSYQLAYAEHAERPALRAGLSASNIYYDILLLAIELLLLMLINLIGCWLLGAYDAAMKIARRHLPSFTFNLLKPTLTLREQSARVEMHQQVGGAVGWAGHYD